MSNKYTFSNPSIKRDAQKRALYIKHYGSSMISRFLVAVLSMLPVAAVATDRVCAPPSMLRVVTALDVPSATKGHFVQGPKTLYRYGERYGRIEGTRDTEAGLHQLIVIDEPHLWTADLVSRNGNYQRDQGPTFNFRAVIFGDPNIQSAFINGLEFGCEVAWLVSACAARTKVHHARLGAVERLEYVEGIEAVHLYLKSGMPSLLEFHRDGQLRMGVKYLEYTSGLPFMPALFQRPEGIRFAGEDRK